MTELKVDVVSSEKQGSCYVCKNKNNQQYVIQAQIGNMVVRMCKNCTQDFIGQLEDTKKDNRLG